MLRLGFRRTPASLLHSLLISIPPEGEEPGEHVKDGIVLPVGGVCDLTPTGEEHSSGPSSSSGPAPSSGPSPSWARPCGLCVVKRARYTCPRCNVPYCSLSCYRGDAHTSCSEDFYRECVRAELKLRGGAGQEEQRSMREVLLRLRSGGEEEERLGTEALMLLSRLAQIQESGVEGHEGEVESILHQLGAGPGAGRGDEDDGEDQDDLWVRLRGVNMDAVGGDELWDLLPERERQMFLQLLKDGALGAMVTVWRPWWEEHERDAEALIQEITTPSPPLRAPPPLCTMPLGAPPLVGAPPPVGAPPLSSLCTSPPVGAPPLSSLCTTPPVGAPPLSSLCTTPSPSVRFTLVNVLFGYCFSLRLFNGDASESLRDFSHLLLQVSECLGRGRTFHTFSHAVCSATAAAVRSAPGSAPQALQAVAHVLSGRSRSDPAGYTLSALGHMTSVLARVRAQSPREDAPFRRACLLAEKKCVFLQAWAREGVADLGALAREAWRESGRASEERERMERERRRLQGALTRAPTQKTLIQEIS